MSKRKDKKIKQPKHAKTVTKDKSKKQPFFTTGKVMILGTLVLLVAFIFAAQGLGTKDQVIGPDGEINTDVVRGEEFKRLSKDPDHMFPSFRDTNSLEGTKYSRKDFEGKKTMYFFFASHCTYCTDMVPELEAFMKEQDEMQVVAFNLTLMEESNVDDVRDFVEKSGLTAPVLLDDRDDIGYLRRVVATPTSFFVDEKGEIMLAVPGLLHTKDLHKVLELMNDV